MVSDSARRCYEVDELLLTTVRTEAVFEIDF